MSYTVKLNSNDSIILSCSNLRFIKRLKFLTRDAPDIGTIIFYLCVLNCAVVFVCKEVF